MVLSFERINEILRLNPHLNEYLEQWVSKGLNPPVFVEKPTEEMKGERNINIIYPIGDPLFVHVYSPDNIIGYKRYVIIEPPRLAPELYNLIELKLAEYLGENDVSNDPYEREKVLLNYLDKVCVVSNNVNYLKINKKMKRIPLSRKDYELVRYHLIRDKVGVGFIEPFLKDPYLEDITCPGVGYMYVVHKIFGSLQTNIKFDSDEELSNFALRLSEQIGKPVSHAKPVVDATLPDGSRINIVYGKDVSKKGSNFTIRKFASTPISVTQLIKWGTLDARIAAYLWIMLSEGMSLFVCGETASGKTTTLNAIAAFIKPIAKVVSIEDTPEVTLPHGNWVSEVTRETRSEDTSITMFDLLKAALRQRPNYIIVGEIRGREGNIAFQAMQTGHPVMSTFHAGSVEKLIQRLTNYPIEVPKSHIDNLNIVLIQSAVYDKSGILKRRVLSVNEIIGYDPKRATVVYVPVFTWDSVSDKFLFRGLGSSYLLEEKIALMRGVARRNINRLYDELDLRARFLNLLVEKRIFNYFDVWELITKTYDLGIESVMKNIDGFIKVASK
ncbi:MAG: type II/IV secretion system ATPase subunit [Thermoprotei archaeon]